MGAPQNGWFIREKPTLGNLHKVPGRACCNSQFDIEIAPSSWSHGTWLTASQGCFRSHWHSHHCWSSQKSESYIVSIKSMPFPNIILNLATLALAPSSPVCVIVSVFPVFSMVLLWRVLYSCKMFPQMKAGGKRAVAGAMAHPWMCQTKFDISNNLTCVSKTNLPSAARERERVCVCLVGSFQGEKKKHTKNATSSLRSWILTWTHLPLE